MMKYDNLIELVRSKLHSMRQKRKYAHSVTRIQNWAHKLHLHGFHILPRLLTYYLRRHYFCEISYKAQIAPSVVFPHSAFCVVIGNSAIIGEGTKILHGVTIGGREGHQGEDLRTNPTIGCNVIVGAGAFLLGPIHVGDHARIGANAVVLTDVKANEIVCGVPATVHYSKRNMQ